MSHLSNLIKMHESLSECYKRSVYKILKQQGITGHLQWANTFRMSDNSRHGYYFKMKDGRHGEILGNDNNRIEWEV